MVPVEAARVSPDLRRGRFPGLCFDLLLLGGMSVQAMAVRAVSSLASSFPRQRLLPSPFASRPPAPNHFLPNQTAYKHLIRGTQAKAMLDAKQKSEERGVLDENWRIKMLYDGECPLCMREVNMLKERNKLYDTIKFIDISSPDYSPEDNQGLDYETVMGRIHAILSDGTVVQDVEAFRRLYEEVGLGWVYAVTKYEPIASIANAIYGVWAKYRLQITGRPPLEVVMEARRKNMGETCNNSKACKM